MYVYSVCMLYLSWSLLYVYFLYYIADIIRKHYSKLCQSISVDYEKSISKLLQLKLLSDHGLELIYSAENKNAAVIGILIVGCSDKNILTFCDLMDELIEIPTLKYVVEELRHGKKNYVCS